MENKPRVTEADISVAVLKIAARQPNGLATFSLLKEKIPLYVKLGSDDLKKSTNRPNEEMWMQLYRNIKSHSKIPGNIIYERYAIHVPGRGYEITNRGRRYLRIRGY